MSFFSSEPSVYSSGEEGDLRSSTGLEKEGEGGKAKFRDRSGLSTIKNQTRGLTPMAVIAPKATRSARETPGTCKKKN